MSQTIKTIEYTLDKKLLKSKGLHYDNTVACEYDYLVPNKIECVMPYKQDGYASEIIMASGRCFSSKNTVEELYEQLTTMSVIK